MIISIFKDETLYKDLEQYNLDIIEVDMRFINRFGVGRYDGKGRQISEWFDPRRVRKLHLSRTPKASSPDPKVQDRPEYRLVLYASNYLGLFLINLLYKQQFDVLIEDFGVGDGRFLYYLSKCGYRNFSAWDAWTQTIEALYHSMMQRAAVTPALNNPSTNPVVVNSCASPFVFITHGIDKRTVEEAPCNIHPNRNLDNLELVCFYTNRHWETILAPLYLEPRGYTYLCRDEGDLAVAYARNDKWEEFHQKLQPYKIGDE